MGRSTYHPLPYLPTEVVSKILALLEIKELVACQCTSRRLRGIVSGSLLLQYHIRLAASGMHDGSLSEASTVERAAGLAAMPQFSDGVIASRRSYAGSPRTHWTLEFDFVVARFSLDAAQDLLALVPISATPGPSQWFEPRILLRALSTGQPHPLASPSAATTGAIELAEHKLQPIMDGDTTSIHGSYLGTVVHGGATDELAIWNWKTGEREWGMPLDRAVGQWCFLDDAHILFPKNVFAGSPRAGRAAAATGGPCTRACLCAPGPAIPTGSSMGARLLSRPTPDPSASLSAFAAGELFHPSAEDHLLTVELWAYYASGLGGDRSAHPDARPALHAAPFRIRQRRPGTRPAHRALSPPLEHPRDMAPLGPLAHGMRRLSWTCGTNSRFRAVRSTAQHSRPSSASSSSLRRKTVSVWDLHPGRTEQALAALRCSGSDSDGSAGGAAVIQLACSCGGGGGGDDDDDDNGRSRAIEAAPPSSELQQQPQQQAEWPYVLSEVPLPREIQEADPIGIKFAMCGDALVVLELGDHETNKLHVLTF
ncbi:hypothetical protein EDB83DRAFT_2567379 [Lactarius deliciosus]|nr:hypothetical protein EDB83DRAFT_2567379 [Lactarius deliciosus]